MKRAKELELVVVDKRAKRKESRVLDSNGESGALRGHFLSCERGALGEGVMNFNGRKAPTMEIRTHMEESGQKGL